MPELPEVETTVRGLTPVLQGRRITDVVLNRADLRRPMPGDLAERLVGARVTGLGRRAKFGLIATDRGDTLVFHLGMSGRWRIDPGEADKHDHVVLRTDQGVCLALNDPRRFGSLDLMRTNALAEFPSFRGLGPEPFGADLTPDRLAAALAGRRAPMKAMLLDQRVIAGLGNIYVCEALFRSGIAPDAAAGSVPAAALGRLVPAIRAVLEEAIADGGSTLRDYAQPDGSLGYFATRFRVYGREGAPCGNCGDTVARQVHSGRSTFFCPTCQSPGSGAVD